MVELMEKAISQLTQLPPAEQERVAQWILDELEDEKRWDLLFARSQDALAQLADKVLADYEAGLTEELDPDDLPD
jgi:hypothetical protein